MADGHFPTLVSRDKFPNSATNTIFVTMTDGTDTALIDGSGNLQVILAANDGTDIGDVTINNGAGASAVNIQDGGNTITVDGTVAISGSVTVTASQLDIDDLNKNDDEVLVWVNTAKDGTGTDYVPIVDADGHLQVDVLSGGGGGTEYNEDDATPATIVGGATLIERDDVLSTVTPIEGDWIGLRGNARGALWVELDLTNDVTIADGGNSITVDNAALSVVGGGAEATALRVTIANDSTGLLSVDDNGSSLTIDNSTLAVVGGGAEATAMRVTIANDSTGLISIDDNGGAITIDSASHDSTPVNANLQIGDADVTTGNPVPVTIVDPGVSSTEIHDYDTAAVVAGDATDNHDYTASGGTFVCRQISVSASGGAKVEVINDATGTPATVFVGFIPKEGGTLSHKFEPAVEVANADVLRLTRTNRQGASQDLYSTIEGNQL